MNKPSLFALLMLSMPVCAESNLMLGGGGGDGADSYHAGLEWRQAWRSLGGGHLWYGVGINGSYWESDDDDLLQLSLMPMLHYRFEHHSVEHQGGWTPFLLAGVGPAWISQTRLGSRDLSSRFQFSSRVGVGVAVAHHSLALEGWHLSNGGIKEPNDGISSWNIIYRYDF
ncbi:acyloxyacyl hydrolase [uncultured Oceanisphaera sp.]|uniref:acyloxyacyl hydrolase n=1 Tax=uncultured Oceanisphaera sp. TaxID=353858 RepID=UPI00262FD8CA|nr:acyloxyacyl hydrolase [uncultured Oceanisphaera sp.]